MSFNDSLCRSYCLLIHDICIYNDFLNFGKRDLCGVSDALVALVMTDLCTCSRLLFPVLF